ncbi:MAG TPA: RNA polymerase sigma factor [Thermoanaerobaculia bacterium]|nr:RNA polymerase sigma factor [Thermoanaerobaculia bacterium]
MIDTMNLPLAMVGRAMAASREGDRALAAMDEDEFRAFYERTARPLWAYLSRLTRDPHQADDLLQEAYYRFCRAGARHDSEAHRRNSLFQIATNLARDSARRAGRHRDVPLDEEDARGAEHGGHLPQSTSPAPERQAVIRTDLARAMQHLEPRQRELLWLAYAQGASHDEIAGILGLRSASVRTLLHRARRKLAGILTAGAADDPQEARR